MNASPPRKADASKDDASDPPKPDKPAVPQVGLTPKIRPHVAAGASSDKVPAVIKEDSKPALVPPRAPPAVREVAPPENRLSLRPPASRSRLRPRHFMVLASFVLLVILPSAVTAWYLWTRAADQYASYVGFSVRTEEQGSAIGSLLGPLNLGGASTAPDAAVLFYFIQSQGLVAQIDKKLDLRQIWSKVDPSVDPVFAYHPPGTIEDLLAHWERKVRIVYDGATGLIELTVLAFTPEDAQRIAEEIFGASTAMINELSAIAREDAIRYARDELDETVERLKVARSAMTEFRNRTQIVDPSVDLQGQAGLLSTLNVQLAEALIELDLLKQTTRSSDPRIAQAERKIQVIETRIAEEKQKLGIGDANSNSEVLATLVGEFERLAVDREFAEQTYTAALASYDNAQAEARRQTRYLAAHVRPTLAEQSEYPQRLTLLGLVSLFAFLSWSILVLVAYSLRDRR